MNTMPLAMLAIFAGLSMNLVLQLGLGMREIAVTGESDRKRSFIQLGIMFIIILMLWFVFSFPIAALPLGFFTYMLVFPLSSLAYYGVEYLVRRFAVNHTPEKPAGFYIALIGGALFITLNIAGGFVEALVLALGFMLGVLLTFVIISEIRRRSLMEEVPLFLRGTPLVLISLGLLAMVFSFSALMFFRALRGGQ